VGSVVARLCGQFLKPCLLELGGKAPAIVCDDADLDLAVEACVFGAFYNSGQICMSTERIIVAAAVAEEFQTRLQCAMDKIVPDNGTMRLVNRASADKVRALVNDAATKGAEILGSDHADNSDQGSWIRPKIVKSVTPNMDTYDTESFGPTASMFIVDNDEQAIALANDTVYGLSAAVFTADLARAFKIARRLVTSAVHINKPTVHDEPLLPHGGVKSSGYGRFSRKDCLKEWTRSKTVTWQET